MVKKTKRSFKWIKQDWIKKSNGLKSLGIHLIIEFWGGEEIKDSKKFEDILIKAAKAAKATPLKVNSHKFSPHGITGVVLLAESHITFHSWPEFKYLALDIFTCGQESKPYKALDYLKKELKPKNVQIVEIKRGIV
jgi:S-adenosylmethionine decarboxylase